MHTEYLNKKIVRLNIFVRSKSRQKVPVDPSSRGMTKGRAVYMNGSWKLAPVEEESLTIDEASNLGLLVGRNTTRNAILPTLPQRLSIKLAQMPASAPLDLKPDSMTDSSTDDALSLVYVCLISSSILS
jgi:hypothetical protein